MLLEVIVAFAILVLGLAGLFGSVSIGTHAAAFADRQRAASVAAQSLIAELGRSRPIEDGASEGDLAEGQHWRIEIERLPPADDAPPQTLEGHQVAVTITWLQGGRRQNLGFRTLLLKARP
jgi:hypothetical protein